jgi:hypothetical protein
VSITFLDDPFRDWPNDDLLISPESVDRVGLIAPSLVPILDWPAIRDSFVAHEEEANRERRHSQRFGMLALLCAGTGLLFAATAPMSEVLDPSATRPLAIIVSTLTLVGGALAIMHWIGSKSRSAWLIHRFWTERLRQFYFQFLVNHLNEAAAAMDDEAGLSRFHALRSRAFDIFRTSVMADVPHLIHATIADEIDRLPWIDPAWRRAQTPRTNAPRLIELVAALGRARIEIQCRYAEKKLLASYSSPRIRHLVVQTVSDSLSILAILLAPAIGIALIIGYTVSSPLVTVLATSSALAGAGVIILRALGEGLQLRADSERYAWYRLATADLLERFRGGDTKARIVALREIEHLSYQEMRRFIEAHKKARFLL